MLVSAEVVSPDPLHSSFHYTNNHLCTLESGPNEKKIQVRNTHTTPPPPPRHNSFPQWRILGFCGRPSRICT